MTHSTKVISLISQVPYSSARMDGRKLPVEYKDESKKLAALSFSNCIPRCEDNRAVLVYQRVLQFLHVCQGLVLALQRLIAVPINVVPGSTVQNDSGAEQLAAQPQVPIANRLNRCQPHLGSQSTV